MTPEVQPPTGQPGHRLTPPDSGAGHGPDKPVNAWLIGGGLSFVVILGLAAVLVLPKLVSETHNEKPHNETPIKATEQAMTGSDPASAQEAINPRARAEQLMQDFLLTRARLELANAPVWGEPEWIKALEGATRGDQLFGERQFAMAAEVLAGSLELLLFLEADAGQRLATALQSGSQALQQDDGGLAEVFFTTALSIDNDNQDAIDGLEQARVRPDVLALMTSGELARSMDDLTAARVAYLAATELDSTYEAAKLALQDVNQQLRDRQFTEVMSRALSALEAEDMAAADAALRQAERLKPGDEVVKDTQQQLEQTRQRLWIGRQRKKAISLVHFENWPEVVTTYREVLAIVPKAAFARQGLAFALDRERLHQQLDHYLEDPTRVYADELRANAEQLIESVGKPPGSEPRLAEKILQLQTLVMEAKTPQLVVLQSDGLTSVQIYHVGQLGQFTRQQLELRPGTYTVVGSRPGYRDVRQTFAVKPGSGQTMLDIRCEEPV